MDELSALPYGNVAILGDMAHTALYMTQTITAYENRGKNTAEFWDFTDLQSVDPMTRDLHNFKKPEYAATSSNMNSQAVKQISDTVPSNRPAEYPVNNPNESESSPAPMTYISGGNSPVDDPLPPTGPQAMNAWTPPTRVATPLDQESPTLSNSQTLTPYISYPSMADVSFSRLNFQNTHPPGLKAEWAVLVHNDAVLPQSRVGELQISTSSSIQVPVATSAPATDTDNAAVIAMPSDDNGSPIQNVGSILVPVATPAEIFYSEGHRPATENPNQLDAYDQTILPENIPVTLASTPSQEIVNLQTSGGYTILAVGSSRSILEPMTTAAPVMTFAGQTFASNDHDEYVVQDKTLTPGGPAVTIANGPSPQVVGLQTSNGNIILAVGSSSSVLPLGAANPTDAPVVTFAGHEFAPDGHDHYVIQNQTLSPGGPLLTVDSAPSQEVAKLQTFAGNFILAVGTSSSVILPLNVPAPNFVLNGQTIAQNRQGHFIVDQQTLIPDGPSITVTFTDSQHLVALQTSGGRTALVVDSSEANFPLPPTSTSFLTFNGQTFSANGQGQYVVGSQTLNPGGPLLTVDSGSSAHIVGLQTSGGRTALIVDSSSTTITPLPTNPPVITFNGQTVSVDKKGQYIIDNQTLTPGSPPLTVGSGSSTHLLGLQASGDDTVLEVDSSSTTLAPLPTSVPAITFDGQTFQADQQGRYIVGNQTLSPGSLPVTIGSGISAHLVGLQISGDNTILEVDSSITTLPPSPTADSALTIDDHVYTANSQGAYVINDQTLIPAALVSTSSISSEMPSGGGSNPSPTGGTPSTHRKNAAIRDKRLAMSTCFLCLATTLVVIVGCY